MSKLAAEARRNDPDAPTIEQLSMLAFRDMSLEAKMHYNLVAKVPLYWATRMWHPVVVADTVSWKAGQWLIRNGHLRGTRESRNDWLSPYNDNGRTLFLFREADLAVLFKLKWS